MGNRLDTKNLPTTGPLRNAGSSSVSAPGSPTCFVGFLCLAAFFILPLDRDFTEPVEIGQEMNIQIRKEDCVRFGVLSEGGDEKSSSVSAYNGRYFFLAGMSVCGLVETILCGEKWSSRFEFMRKAWAGGAIKGGIYLCPGRSVCRFPGSKPGTCKSEPIQESASNFFFDFRGVNQGPAGANQVRNLQPIYRIK